MHTGQHWDPALSAVFFEELGLGRAGRRARPPHLGRRRRSRRRCGGSSTDVRARRGARLRRHELDARRARGPRDGLPVAHVEAGLRSGDLEMPEERNRIEVDALSALALRARRALGRDAAQRGRRRRDPRRRRRDGRRGGALRARSRASARRSSRPLGLEPGGYVARDRAPRGERAARAAAADRRRARPLAAAGRAPRPPAHAGVARASRRSRSPPHDRLIEPLGYLDFAALASQAAVIATDSGGLQKEAYWYGVPCVTMRPSTEWVDTVEVGANVLVDDDPDRIAAALARRADARRAARRSTATATPPSGSPPCSAVRCRAVHRDVAIVGAGYVGVPLAQVFADAGRSVLLVDVERRARRAAEPRRELHRGRPQREAEAARRGARPARDDRLRRAARGRRDPDRAADAALEAARARPLDRARRRPSRSRRGSARATSSCSSRRPIRARRATRSCRSSSGARASRAGVDFHLAFSPERVDPGRVDHTTKTVPKVVGGINEASTEAAAALYGSAIDTRPPRLHARGGRADEAAREHLPLRQHRARQRARAAVRPDGDRHLGGRRRRRDEAVRLHALRARPRPRRPLHPDRPVLPHLEGARVRLLDAVHRARRRGQPEHAVLLPLARLAGAQPRRRQVAQRARASSCSASRTRPTSPTCASRRP